ncbi:3-hydroxyacyl-CoA dehydrogenase family protein [Streptomyces sp. NPDC093225]|uniref:3-hydroxyacyl-CoA dehydrogenase family protein n=1 Tax=Streptomyces sp. NPDC093225 TaxID=3366034 RepID=UPI00382597B1
MAKKSSVVGIVGLGTVGEALLAMVRSAGYDVIGVDSELDVLARVDRRMKAADAESGTESGHGQGSWTLTHEVDGLGTAGVVIEAVPDEQSVKSDVLRRLDGVCPDRTVFVSTASSVSLTRLAAASGRPARTLGLRFGRPPAPGTAVEPVRTAMSCDDAVAALDALVADTGLAVKPLGARVGDDATALVYAYLNRAVAMVEAGHADQDSVDTAMRLGCGLPAGPLETVDQVGPGTVHAKLLALHASTGDAAYRPAPLLTAMVEAGLEGRAGGRGFYAYDALGRPEGTRHSVMSAPVGCAVRTVGVIGSGTMARGIAEVTASAGLPTVLVARDRAKADLALAAVDSSLAKSVARGRRTPEAMASARALLTAADDCAAVADCDLVIEATAEELDVKRAVFATLGGVCRPGALLATTTSSLSVAACAEASGRDHDVLGLHFFNPAPVMRLVEVVRAPLTSDQALSTANAFCAALGKTAVPCQDRAGFIVNYLLFPYLADAIRLLDRADVDARELDAAVENGFGYPMGPFALLDTIGLDVSLAILRRLSDEFPEPCYAPPTVLEQLVARGHVGRKSGQGFLRTRRNP